MLYRQPTMAHKYLKINIKNSVIQRPRIHRSSTRHERQGPRQEFVSSGEKYTWTLFTTTQAVKHRNLISHSGRGWREGSPDFWLQLRPCQHELFIRACSRRIADESATCRLWHRAMNAWQSVSDVQTAWQRCRRVTGVRRALPHAALTRAGNNNDRNSQSVVQ